MVLVLRHLTIWRFLPICAIPAQFSPTFEHIGQLVLEEDEPGQLFQAVLLGRDLGVVHLDEVDAGDVAVVVDLFQRLEVEVGLSRLAVI